MKHFLSSIGLALILLGMLSFGPCDESLPVYQQPEKIFAARLEGAYSLTITDNSMKVYLVVKNIFDETFQGQAVLKGTIEIISARDPSVRKTFSINPTNVIQAQGYDRQTGVLTIDAGDSVRFGVSWDLTADDNGRDLRTDFFKYIVDPQCEDVPRCLAFREDFILKGQATVFTRTGSISAEQTLYAFCFASRWVNPKYCPPIITSAPCTLQPPQPSRACFLTDFSPIL